MKQYKVLFLAETFSYSGGATSALIKFVRNMPFISPNSKIFVKKTLETCRNSGIDSMITIGSGEDAFNEFLNGNYDIIHWFKSSYNSILNELISASQKVNIEIPLLTYVLQNPAYRYALLSPNELKFSKHIVFIDKASYNQPLYSFIPETCKSMIYCCFRTEQDFLKMDELRKSLNVQKQHDKIVFGRGSTLNKCPKDMFEKIFDQIDCNNKKFVIIGSGWGRYWIEKKIKDRVGKYEVELYSKLSYEEWIEKLLSFDIFLYYLPEDGYSSIDGTLEQAMFYGIPVVYYGPEAPKESFIHGYDGFVAEKKEDVVKYCNILAHDPDLRKQIGENGRRTNIEKFNLKITLSDYEKVYNIVCNKSREKRIDIPLSYFLYYYRTQIINPVFRLLKVLRIVLGLIVTGSFSDLVTIKNKIGTKLHFK